ncbi:ornithine decarboxylase 2-like protein [Leptotrombidium deliense]|uniref:ornithine decarboxylase n=1 Tax=Leptotrombidium deliense TaxID=299467 RepID=A0A443SGP0_9ACAR|nr:ornithine decarboxylase 2-like protein [Leptotrombidium deliense]
MKIPAMNSPLAVCSSIDEIVRDVIATSGHEDPFYVVDIQDIIKKHKNWLLKMPRIKPYYAVKCNSCPLVLELLTALGLGFDCASKGEIDTILDLNVSPSNIIFANPCKTMSFIKHAANVGVDLMTFDNEQELYKVAKFHPKARLIIRIKVDDSHAVCRFSSKFGADLDKAAGLLSVAKSLGLNVVGVSFHVGSGCENAKSYADAIANAKYVFDLGTEMGFQMNILDIGGGFPGTSTVEITFDEIAKVVCEALDHHFPEGESDVTIIAEPGRYYVASAFTLATLVIAKRLVTTSDGQKTAMYYLNDGVYGSFNCTIFDHCEVYPSPFYIENEEHNVTETLNTTLWGPTCDSMDCIKKNVMLPEMEVGDWIVFKEMGAYTIAAASTFNGFQLPSLKYFADEYTMATLRNLQSWHRISKHFNIDEETDAKDIFDVDIHHLGLISVH